ncbi:MAG: GTPase Era [Rhodospirillales bacterium]|nr:GTPase Era [Rhodospirillales bacterium]MCB9997300.1 GTPase Era [Rhodospirillales bacterium]
MTEHCGVVAVLGAPNAGKSTLINRLVGAKVSIVSSKVQTTRALVRGIALQESTQIVLIDTPGIFKPKQRLEKAMVAAAWQGLEQAELALLLIDTSLKNPLGPVEDIIKRLEQAETRVPLVLALNKVDKIAKDKLLVLASSLNERLDFAATFMISALHGGGVEDLLDWLASQMPEGEWLFPEDQVSDMPMRLLAAEITREKLFNRLHQELPYGLMVETEQWENFDNGDIKISQIVYVSRDSHKGIVLGKGGAMIREVGAQARQELEEILETKVHIKLFVKLQENWKDDPEKYHLWGLDYSA